MMLTKEECYIALNDMYDSTLLSKDGCEENREILAQLIEEHFSNPPLTSEELKVDMWVWDKKFNQWIQIDETWSSYKKFINVWIVGSDLLQTIEYEPDRFYRKEVQE